MPLFMAEVLLFLDSRDTVRRTAFLSLAAFPSLFRALLAFHIAGHRISPVLGQERAPTGRQMGGRTLVNKGLEVFRKTGLGSSLGT